jgi:hypothetical protein
MWILLMITTLGNNPSGYEYQTHSVSKTMTECINILKALPKAGPNQEFYCVKAK